MPRLASLPADWSEPAELVDAIRARRGGELQPLDRLLLHSPALAEGWHALLAAVDEGLTLQPPLRLLAACAVLRMRGVDDLAMLLARRYIACGGSAAQVEALADLPAAVDDTALFAPAQRAVLALCLDMTRRVQVTENHFAAIRALLPARQAVELIGVIAAYDMVARVMVALDVPAEATPAAPARH